MYNAWPEKAKWREAAEQWNHSFLDVLRDLGEAGVPYPALLQGSMRVPCAEPAVSDLERDPAVDVMTTGQTIPHEARLPVWPA